MFVQSLPPGLFLNGFASCFLERVRSHLLKRFVPHFRWWHLYDRNAHCFSVIFNNAHSAHFCTLVIFTGLYKVRVAHFARRALGAFYQKRSEFGGRYRSIYFILNTSGPFKQFIVIYYSYCRFSVFYYFT